MILKSEGIIDGVVDDKYGKRGKMDEYNIANCSLPIEIIDPPEKAISFALFFGR